MRCLSLPIDNAFKLDSEDTFIFLKSDETNEAHK